jgi:hypothetical protein
MWATKQDQPPKAQLCGRQQAQLSRGRRQQAQLGCGWASSRRASSSGRRQQTQLRGRRAGSSSSSSSWQQAQLSRWWAGSSYGSGTGC